MISGDERNALRKEFVNAAYQTFLAGKFYIFKYFFFFFYSKQGGTVYLMVN